MSDTAVTRINSVFDSVQCRAAFLAATVALVFYRTPEILLEGRFWAEGAAYYFLQTYDRGFDAVVFTSFQGYYSLFNWLVSGIAVQLPLELAPLVNVYASLLVMLAPSVFILFLPNRIGLQGWRRCLLAVCLAFPIFNQEIWLALISCQFWFALGAAVLLFADTNGRRTQLIAGTYLMLASLTGVLTSFLAPFFLARLLLLKDRTFLFPAIAVTFGAAIQAALVIHFLGAAPGSGSTIHPLEQLYALFVRLMTMPLMGEHIYAVWRAASREDTARLVWYCLSALAVLTFLIAHAARTYRKVGLVILTMVFFATGLAILGSMSTDENALAVYLHPAGEGRYFLMGTGLLYVLLFLRGSGRYSWAANGISIVLLALYINTSAYTYVNWQQKGPSWQDEIAAWRENPERVVAVWPGNHWIIQIDPAKQRWPRETGLAESGF